MSFLDNLENTLKSLEGRDQDGMEDRKQRDAHRARAAAAAPWAEKLKKGPYTQDLLGKATRAGYRLRAKVNLTWIDTTLRLAVRDSRLELRPEKDGVQAVFLQNGEVLQSQRIDLTGDPELLLNSWLETIPPAPEPVAVEDLDL